VKFARYRTHVAGPELLGAFLIEGTEESGLARRVQQLIAEKPAGSNRQSRRALMNAVVLAAVSAAAMIQYDALLRHTHDLLEWLAR
jgi:acetyl/propionyl-CoA carboxylase alpha subunit